MDSTGPGSNIPFSREPRALREALAAQLPLQEGRKVAFHPPPGTGSGTNEPIDESTWILAVVTKCINQDKNWSVNPLPESSERYWTSDTIDLATWYKTQSHRRMANPERKYTNHPVATHQPNTPLRLYNTTLRSIIPLSDPDASSNSASHQSAYPVFPAGATVMALYPDTSCFYRAEVLASPRDIHPTGRVSLFHEASDPRHHYRLLTRSGPPREHSRNRCTTSGSTTTTTRNIQCQHDWLSSFPTSSSCVGLLAGPDGVGSKWHGWRKKKCPVSLTPQPHVSPHPVIL